MEKLKNWIASLPAEAFFRQGPKTLKIQFLSWNLWEKLKNWIPSVPPEAFFDGRNPIFEQFQNAFL